jgi:predicted translin family RNA/ssDNA-binding protein
MMKKEEAKKKLEEISVNVDLIADKYKGKVGYGKIEKEQLLKDFQEAYTESTTLLKLVREIYGDLPESFNNINSPIYNYVNSIGSFASLINAQLKSEK